MVLVRIASNEYPHNTHNYVFIENCRESSFNYHQIPTLSVLQKTHLLRFTESIADDFNKGLATAAIFVNLKGAFDNRVWRHGLIYKHHKMGINGRMLRWIKNFLSCRTVKCHVQDTTGPSFNTCRPTQGRVLSPVLFNTYTKDMYEISGAEHVMFADDGTVWKSNKDPLIAV